jgi:hypothetical protein
MRKANQREVLASTIERFVNGNAGPYEWDDVVGVPFTDPGLESIRQECLSVEERFPPTKKGEYCSDEGGAFLLGIAARLRREA